MVRLAFGIQISRWFANEVISKTKNLFRSLLTMLIRKNWKNCFTESSTRLYLKRSLADVFAQSVKFCTVHCHILMSTDVWTRWFINPWSNRQKMDGCSFQQRLRQNLAFVLTQENTLSSRFHFKVKRKSIGSSKNGTSAFQNSPPFGRSACFYVTTTGNFERFQYLARGDEPSTLTCKMS